ncbi:MAG: hypothetical protein HYY42_03685 [Chloroflexi bacterium]|nr:hypothetical protein [Chloroflexota bacterium]
MTETVLKEIVHRAVRDGSYRAQLRSDPAGALAGFSLTAEERSAITSGDPTRLTALGIDQRMSKAFAAGVLGDASKVIVVDAGGGGNVIDEASQAVRSPMWRIEQDLDTGASLEAPELHGTPDLNQDSNWDGYTPAGTTLAEEDAFDANGLRIVERGSDAGASLEAPELHGTPDLNQDSNWDTGGYDPTDY